MEIRDGNLKYKLINRASLDICQTDRMFTLMEQNYNKMNLTGFLKDLSNKDIVGLITDQDQVIQGFTTFGIDLGNNRSNEFRTIFSGDTIISPDHWGTQVLMRGWCYTIGNIIATDTSVPWFWYLLSKGHRTYMYLPLFFLDYYPNVDKDEEDVYLMDIMDHVSNNLYKGDWKSDKGVIIFEKSYGELTEDLVEKTYQKNRSKYVSFFLERNPGFYKGDELVCIAPLYPENFRSSARKFIEKGMEEPLVL